MWDTGDSLLAYKNKILRTKVYRLFTKHYTYCRFSPQKNLYVSKYESILIKTSCFFVLDNVHLLDKYVQFDSDTAFTISELNMYQITLQLCRYAYTIFFKHEKTSLAELLYLYHFCTSVTVHISIYSYVSKTASYRKVWTCKKQCDNHENLPDGWYLLKIISSCYNGVCLAV